MSGHWLPQQLTRAQQEERRLEAIKLYQQGNHTQAKLVAHFGVSVKTVEAWLKRYRRQGEEALKATISSGRPPALGADQKTRLTEMLRQGPKTHGQKQDLWTTERVADLIGTTITSASCCINWAGRTRNPRNALWNVTAKRSRLGWK